MLPTDTLRLSMDAKATVKVGPFARGGKSRVHTRAADHDFKPKAKVMPVGIFLPASLDSVDAVIQFAKTMTWQGKHPLVE